MSETEPLALGVSLDTVGSANGSAGAGPRRRPHHSLITPTTTCSRAISGKERP
jgi:hypothetical protein